MLARTALVAALLILAAAPVARADATPEYFDLPAGFSSGTGIAAAPDGTVWFSATPTDLSTPHPSLGRLIVAQASPGTANGMATFPTPVPAGTGCCANFVRSVAVDGTGRRVWFVQSDGIVGWADPSAVSPGTSAGISARLLTGVGDLWDVAADSRSGLAWFTEHSAYNLPPYPGNRIASVDAALGVDELPNLAVQGGVLVGLRYDAKPAGIALDPDGRPWFAEADPGNPGWRIATASGDAYEEYEVKPCAAGSPCSGSYTGTGITDVAVAHDGSVWFTNQLRNEVGRFDLATRTFTSYSLPAIDPRLAGGQARQIAVAPDGSLWVAELGFLSYPNANAIVKIVPSQPTPTATVYRLGAGRYPYAVAPDTTGDVWFAVGTDAAPGKVGRLADVTTPAGGSGGGGSGGGGSSIRAVAVARAGPPKVVGTSVSIDQICVGPPQDPCSLVFILSAHEYVTGFPGSRNGGRASAAAAARGARKRRRAAPTILGRKALTLHGGQRRRVTISLNATGRRLLRRRGRLTVYFTVTQRGADGRGRRIRKAKLTFRAPSARRRARR